MPAAVPAALGGISAFVGYGSGSNPVARSYLKTGSGIPGSFLDTNIPQGLVNQSLNSGGVLGRYDFTVLPPVAVTNPGAQSNTEGDTVSLAITATDSTGGTLVYAAPGLPNGLSINSTSGLITGTITPGASVDSPYTTTVTASDGSYSNTQPFIWNVSNPVAITNPGTQSNTESDTVSLAITATDSTSATLTFAASGLPQVG